MNQALAARQLEEQGARGTVAQLGRFFRVAHFSRPHQTWPNHAEEHF